MKNETELKQILNELRANMEQNKENQTRKDMKAYCEGYLNALNQIEMALTEETIKEEVKDDYNLTEKELIVMKSICEDNIEMTFVEKVFGISTKNGFDGDLNSLGGVLSNLVKKGLITVTEDDWGGSGESMVCGTEKGCEWADTH